MITTGNHVWDKKEVLPYLSETKRILRPANYPPGALGQGSTVLKTAKGSSIGGLQLMGRIFMLPIDCPFRCADEQLKILHRETNIIIVDFHAEATSEKAAMGWYLDGRVSAVIGTHTHVQTADEKILPGGTAYISDVGMTGPENSVIGIKRESAVKKLISQTPKRFEVAEGESTFCAVVLSIDESTGKAEAIKRLQLKP